MAIRIAINGFGRIGRLATRIAKLRHEFNIVAVNDLGEAKQLLTLFKYDSIHGIFPGSMDFDGERLKVEGDSFIFLQEKDPAQLPWKKLQVDYVIEASGVFRTRSEVEKHLQAGARRVVMTVPSKDPIDATIVLGVNDHELQPEHKILSNASCTTNCVAPVVNLLHKTFGIKKGMLNTIHAYTNDQHLLDSPHKDPRRARNAALSIIPTSTGAGKAIGQVIPELQGKLGAIAMRVPVPDGSIVDLILETQQAVNEEKVNNLLSQAAQKELSGILQVTSDPIVSVDIIGNPHSSIADLTLTQCLDDHTLRLCLWYDNEWGYSNRVVDLIERMAEQDGQKVAFTPRGTGHYRSFSCD